MTHRRILCIILREKQQACVDQPLEESMLDVLILDVHCIGFINSPVFHSTVPLLALGCQWSASHIFDCLRIRSNHASTCPSFDRHIAYRHSCFHRQAFEGLRSKVELTPEACSMCAAYRAYCQSSYMQLKLLEARLNRATEFHHMTSPSSSADLADDAKYYIFGGRSSWKFASHLPCTIKSLHRHVRYHCTHIARLDFHIFSLFLNQCLRREHVLHLQMH